MFHLQHQRKSFPYTPATSNHASAAGQPAKEKHHHQAGVLANIMPSTKRKAQPASAPSIDAILETPPAFSRPAVNRKPSWIGPEPPARVPTPGSIIMKLPLTIDFSPPGVQPPVYVASSLNDWEPVEMEYTKNEHGEYSFFKTFTAEEGEYQYKLRLGPGDWWICDTSKPRVDDGAGNENNLLIVRPQSHTLYSADAREPEPEEEYQGHHSPLMKHETFMPDHNPDHMHDKTGPANLIPNPDVAGPLFRHESIAPPTDIVNEEDEDDEPESPPLLRHESVAPTSHEQNHSPLFSHETTAIDDKGDDDDVVGDLPPTSGGRRGSLGERTGSDSSIPEEADPNDPSLEPFPTDHAGILEHLDRTRKSMQAKDSSDRSSSRGSAIASVSPALASVKEGDEEEDLGDSRDGATDRAGLPRDSESPRAQESSDNPIAPITPPMTPNAEESKQIIDSPLGIREKTEQVKQNLRNTKVQEVLDTAKDQAQAAIPLVSEKAQQVKAAVDENLPVMKEKARQAKVASDENLPVIKEKAQEAKDAFAKSDNKGLGLFAIGLGVVMSIGSAALAFWYMKIKGGDAMTRL